MLTSAANPSAPISPASLFFPDHTPLFRAFFNCLFFTFVFGWLFEVRLGSEEVGAMVLVASRSTCGRPRGLGIAGRYDFAKRRACAVTVGAELGVKGPLASTASVSTVGGRGSNTIGVDGFFVFPFTSRMGVATGTRGDRDLDGESLLSDTLPRRPSGFREDLAIDEGPETASVPATTLSFPFLEPVLAKGLPAPTDDGPWYGGR